MEIAIILLYIQCWNDGKLLKNIGLMFAMHGLRRLDDCNYLTDQSHVRHGPLVQA